MVSCNTIARKHICAENVKRLIKQNLEIRTQEKFAELMLVDVRTVRRWLKDGIDSLSTIQEIADTLGISDTEILF